MNNKIGVVGFGRFGQLLADILKADFSVRIVESDPGKRADAEKQGFETAELADLADADAIWLAVPISALEQTCLQLSDIVSGDQTVLDVCSVKVYPSEIMRKHLKNCQTIATHPLFGPDSTKQGLNGLKLALCPLETTEKTAKFWQDYWHDKGVQVIRTTPEKHDRDTIYSLALTQTLARLVGQMEIPNLVLTTKNFEAVKTVTDLSLNDTDQLYHDMLRYNPYFTEMRKRFSRASARVLRQLDEIASERKEGPLDELLAGMTPENMHDEIDWGPAVGKEIIDDDYSVPAK